RRGNAAELFSGIRHIAINVLTNDKVFKAGLRRKMQGKIIRSSLFVLNNSHFMFKN
ncbi:hypothetical protein, partial [Escherichia coli]